MGDVNYSTGFFSVLDLSGSLILKNFESEAKGFHCDISRLKNDLNALEEDYLKAIEKIKQESIDGRSED